MDKGTGWGHERDKHQRATGGRSSQSTFDMVDFFLFLDVFSLTRRRGD